MCAKRERWLKQLLAPGSSLGGARPKATIQDEKGNLWIAKYFDIDEKEAIKIANEVKTIVRDNWERLARKCGLSRNACEYMRPAFDESYK